MDPRSSPQAPLVDVEHRAVTEPPASPAQGAQGAGELRALFDAHYDYVWTSLRRLGVPDRDREDVASELFVRVHQKLDTLDRSRPVRPWLFAFAVRCASDYRRLARHRLERLDGDAAIEPSSTAPLADEALERDERRRLVLDALEALDLDRRAVVVLHDLDETSVPEIARALGIPEGTAYTRLRTGRLELAQAIRRLAERRSR